MSLLPIMGVRFVFFVEELTGVRYMRLVVQTHKWPHGIEWGFDNELAAAQVGTTDAVGARR